MTETEAELAARANLHGFLLEVMIANDFALMPDGDRKLAAFADNITERIERRSRLPPGEQEDEASVEVGARTVIAARRFFQLARKRRTEIAQERTDRAG